MGYVTNILWQNCVQWTSIGFGGSDDANDDRDDDILSLNRYNTNLLDTSAGERIKELIPKTSLRRSFFGDEKVEGEEEEFEEEEENDVDEEEVSPAEQYIIKLLRKKRKARIQSTALMDSTN